MEWILNLVIVVWIYLLGIPVCYSLTLKNLEKKFAPLDDEHMTFAKWYRFTSWFGLIGPLT